ncbi:MAG TPA: protease inhibitor I9 family protein, partial [Nocardioides sp.]|nr:protease inhibitor I9 family protein [Nocardioides sp.]
MRTRRTRRFLGNGMLALALGLSVPAVATADDVAPAAPGDLALVTLDGAGTSAGRAEATELLAEQDAVLAAIGAGEPVYRWTTALNGFALRLTEPQLAALDDQPGVASVEADTIRPLAGRTSLAAVRGAAGTPRLRGGAGVVIGVVDSGI